MVIVKNYEIMTKKIVYFNEYHITRPISVIKLIWKCKIHNGMPIL